MRKDSRMRIPGRMAAWLCIGALGLAQQARAEDDSPEWQLPSYLAETSEEDLYEEDDGDDDGDDGDGVSCGPAVTERRHLVGDVFEYSYRIQVGYGAHDSITLHRVV